MARHLFTHVVIAATAEAVWAALTRFDRYRIWNPFIPSVGGQPLPGHRLRVRIEPPGGRGMTFRPRVIIAEPGHELRWRGRLPVPGLFSGEHVFRIIPHDAASVNFIQEEFFRGLLVPFLWPGLNRKTRAGFESMNHALKRVLEGDGNEAA